MTAPSIRVSSAKKRFGAVLALDGVDLEIAPGERVALVGTNGSGKTTLLRALAGLVRIEGKVTLGGIDVHQEPERALAQVAYVPQVAPPLEASVGDVLRVFLDLRGLALADVEATAGRFGLDLATLRGVRMRDLSGGMKQKLLAAMALATRAPILLCDEPTANLDVQARAAFVEAVRARPKGAILVLCSHRVEEVRALVGRIVELKDGRVVRDELIADPPQLASLTPGELDELDERSAFAPFAPEVA